MTTLQFPSNPKIGDEYDYPPYKYYWDGQKWKTKGIGYNPVNDLRNEVLPTTREAIRRSYAEAGFNLVDGSFEEGGTLTSTSDVLLHKASGKAYSWGGTLPKDVVQGSFPTLLSSTEWVNEFNVLLRNQVCRTQICASNYGFNGSTTDYKSLLKSFMAEPLDKVVDVDIYTSGIAKVADGTKVTRAKGAAIYALGDVTTDTDASSANQGQILEAGNNTTFTGIKIDGQGLKGNGILNHGKTNVTVQLCDLGNGTGQGIHDVGGMVSKYYDNEIHECFHGVQLWLTKNARVRGNHVYQVTGGIWSAAAQDVLAWGNIVHDCSDVGIDWEGGSDCHSFGNKIWACQNGELAIFHTGNEVVSAGIVMGNLSHSRNFCRRYATFKSRTGVVTQNSLSDVGGVCIYGLDATMSGPVSIYDNDITVIDSAADVPSSLKAIHTRSISTQHSDYLKITNNRVKTKYELAFRIQELNKVIFSDNEFTFNGINPVRHEFKNTHSGLFEGNSFLFDGTTSPSSMLYVYTDKAMRGALEINGNDGSKCGLTVFEVDQYVSNRQISMRDNALPKTTTGGITCANGSIMYYGQKLNIMMQDNQALDLAAISAIHKSSALGMGHVSMYMGGLGPVYRIAVRSRVSSTALHPIDTGGTYSTGLFPDVARRVDFNGSTITLVDSDGATANSGLITLEMTNR